MTEIKDTIVYVLKKGKKIVYIGTTNRREQREEEHENDGKKFDKFQVETKPMTEEKAKEEEAKRLDTYRKNHKGKNPEHNKKKGG